MIGAGLIAEAFGLDPVAVLDERDEHKKAVRTAAFLAVGDARERARKQQEAGR